MWAILAGRGPLAVGYYPDRISVMGTRAARISLASADASDRLNSSASPIRRLVLRRLSEAPFTFTQAMEAAQLDDMSKIAFDRRKLTESRLFLHPADERHRSTPRGRGVARVPSSIDVLDPGKGNGNRVFLSTMEARRCRVRRSPTPRAR